VDIRMPPGWDGVQTIARLWEEDPNLQTVICTAYSDYSWKEVIERLGRTDRLLVLKKPFDPVEVRQLACAMVQKWHLMREAQRRVAELEAALRERSQELHARNAEVARLNAELAIARRVALRPEGARQLPGTSVPG
jgi:FixJ family two-component response regulator